MAGLFHWLLRDTAGIILAGTDSPIKGKVRVLFSAPYRKSSLASIATYFAFGGAYAGSAFYFPTFFAEVRGYSQSDAASLVGMSNFIGIVGYLLAAFVGEYLLTRRSVFIIWALGGTIALIGLLWFSESRTSDTIWYGLTAALFYGSLAVLPVLIAEIFPEEVRASALSVCASAPLSLGFAVFPLIVPFVVGSVGWQMGFRIIICPLLALSAMTAFALPNLRSGDDLAVMA